MTNLPLPRKFNWYSEGVPLFDGQGTLYAAGLVKNTNVDDKNLEYFKFRIYKYQGDTPIEVPLQVRANGHGGAFVAPHNGRGYWYAFVDGAGQFNEIPGFIPVAMGGGTVIVQPGGSVSAPSVDLSALTARLDRLDQKVAEAGRNASGAVQAVAYVKGELNALTERVASLPNMDAIWQKIVDGAHAEIEKQWQAWVSYGDQRLLDLLWDRTVKLLRLKEAKNQTAAEMRLNGET